MENCVCREALVYTSIWASSTLGNVTESCLSDKEGLTCTVFILLFNEKKAIGTDTATQDHTKLIP